MKQISGNCVLPFGLWGEEPPEHSVTCVELIGDNYVVSGDVLGRIVVWNVSGDYRVTPMWYLLGHSGSIVTVAQSGIGSGEGGYLVSVSDHREMGVWSCADGRCVKLERNMALEHTKVKAYGPTSSSRRVILVCSGNYQGIHLLDSITLAPLLSLQSCAHSDWVRSACIFEHKHAGMHIVLGLSISSAITMWTLESLDVLNEGKVLFETESKMLLLTCPISISICPLKPRLVMVLASKSVQIYDAASWSLLSEFNSQEASFLSGWFLDCETILLRSKRDQCRLYHVPINLEDELKVNSEPIPLCSLDSGDSDITCETVVVRGTRLTVAVGCGSGKLFYWKTDMKMSKTLGTVPYTDLAILHDLWLDLNMASLTRQFKNMYSITCCHCEPSINSLMMGTSSGDILVMELLQSVAVALFSSSSLKHPFTILSGHVQSVLALQYAKDSSQNSESKVAHWLWSGGEDFSVRLWNLETKVCVSTFNCHSGPVTSFVVGPPLGLTKGKHDGRIMAPKKLAEAEQEILKPINFSTWFGQRLYASFDDDNGVAFLSLETRKVVLQISFFSAVDMIAWRRDQVSVVLSCADGSVTTWDLGVGQLERREIGQIAEDIMDSSTDHVRLSCPPPLLPRLSHLKDRLKHSSLTPLLLYPIHVGRNRLSQILFLDTEYLLVDIHAQTTDKGLLQAQLLLSLINQWDKDSCLDTTLQSTIGLVRPPRQVCYGQVNIKSKSLSFPLHLCDNPVGNSFALLAGVSLCHAINNLPDSVLQSSWPRLSSYIGDKVNISNKNVDNRTEVRQVCCLFATSMATTNLPNLLCSSPSTFSISKIPIILQTFLQKYQDRCLEIREAAKTLLHAALDYFSNDQRNELVQFWGFHGRVLSKPDSLDVKEECFRTPDTLKASRSLSSIFEAPNICDWRSWSSTSEQQHQKQQHKPSEIDQLQAITLIFMGILGCRYGSPDLQLTPSSNVVTISSFRKLSATDRSVGLDDHRLARTTCGFLMSLLSNVPLQNGLGEHKTGCQWSSMRCLAITLLGQGFPVWEPYLEVSTLFTRLLEIVAPAEKILTGWSQGQLLTDDMDAVRSARSSLQVIALARPKVFATVLSIEVLRLQTQSSSSPGSNPTVTTNNGTQSMKGALLGTSQSQPALLAARHEVIEVIRLLCERKTKEMHEVLPEIMDILLACLSKLDLRQYDLQQLFPPIILFRIASSHTSSGKVCVGTRNGQLVFYDVKVGKYNTSPGHGGPVTSVTFSPDGKQLASYSMPDNTVCIWQLFSSGLFGMGSSHQVKLASKLNVPPIKISQTVPDEDHSLLLWLEWSESKAIHLVTNAGLINKIQL